MKTPFAFDAYVIDKQEERERLDAQAALTKKLNAYCDEHGLPHLSADELLYEMQHHCWWLRDFIKGWDATE